MFPPRPGRSGRRHSGLPLPRTSFLPNVRGSSEYDGIQAARYTLGDLTEALATIAEVAIGLAGFSGIVVVLSRTFERRLTPLERYRMFLLLVPSLATSFLGLSIMALYASEVPGALRIGSGLLAVFCLGFPASQVRRTIYFYRKVPELFQAPVIWGILFGYLVVGALSIVHASGAIAETATVVFIGLLWPLFQSALQFARMLFIRPTDPDADD